MKRHGHLWAEVVTEANVHRAFARAAAGKRDRAEVRRVTSSLDVTLRRIACDLAAGVFPFGHYRRFTIYEPKERVIHAARFEERVAHHALMNVCGPCLDRRLTMDVFACRTGMGRTAAVARAAGFARRHRYFLKMDVRKYFESIPHAGLEILLERMFRERPLLDCFRRIIGSHETASGRGLPIGSLISQHLANAYLGPIDRLVRSLQGIGGYVRYMDDMVAWSDTRDPLVILQGVVGEALANLGLGFKPEPFRNRTVHGMDFLGCRIFPGCFEPNRATRIRWGRKMRRLDTALTEGRMGEPVYQRRATALCAHLESCGGSAFRRRSLETKLWSDATGLESGQPRRLVEQQREQLPRLVPQQEQPVEQEHQQWVPPGPSTPWEVRYAQPEAVPVSDPSRE
jgi:RNA-directed DNA polymerase